MMRFVTALAIGLSCWVAMPTTAQAQTVQASFKAQYTHIYPDPASPFLIGPYVVKYTLYDDGTFTNDDGNGGEWELAGTTLTFWYFSRAEATAMYPPFGAATWTGTYTGSMVCDGTIRSPALDPGGNPTTAMGNWKTKGCP